MAEVLPVTWEAIEVPTLESDHIGCSRTGRKAPAKAHDPKLWALEALANLCCFLLHFLRVGARLEWRHRLHLLGHGCKCKQNARNFCRGPGRIFEDGLSMLEPPSSTMIHHDPP